MELATIYDLAADRLEQGMALIKDPSDWCQGLSGMNTAGFFVPPWHEDCVRRCALGSIMAAGQGLEDRVHNIAVDALEAAATRQHPGQGVIMTNDSVTGWHSAILTLFPIAIRRGWRPRFDPVGHSAVLALFPIAIADLRTRAEQHKAEPAVSHAVVAEIVHLVNQAEPHKAEPAVSRPTCICEDQAPGGCRYPCSRAVAATADAPLVRQQ